MPPPPFADDAVTAAFDAFPRAVRQNLLDLRAMIFDVAAATPGVGVLHETLKWGQPAYLTPESRSGSTIRLAAPRQGGFALHVHCQTTIIADARTHFPDAFDWIGTRGVQFAEGGPALEAPLRLLIRSALTYRLRGRRTPKG